MTYFSALPGPGTAPAAGGRFTNESALHVLQMAEGLSFRAVEAERLMVSFVTFEPNTVAPVHLHPEEQLVVVLGGELLFTCGEEDRLLQTGDIVLIPPWVPHGARTLDAPCRELDIFSPPRAALQDLMKAAVSTQPQD